MKYHYHEHAFSAVVRQLSVLVLRFDQRSDLTVNHAVVLGDEDNVIEVVPVLREKLDPLHAVFVQSVSAVEWYLRFVYDDNPLMFVTLGAVEMFLRVLLELINGHFKRGDIDEFALVLLRV